MSADLELTITRTIPAPREAVFRAWLDADALTRFMCPGMTVPRAEADPRVGGAFLIVMKAGDKELPHTGEYREIREFDRLAFSWQSPFTAPVSLVTLTFRALGPRETELTLHHAGFPTEESRDNHHGGWTAILETLARALT